MKKKLKVVAAVAAAVVVIIVALQNTQTVETKILFATIAMSRALLLFVTMLIGFGLGIVSTYHYLQRPKKEKQDAGSAEG